MSACSAAARAQLACASPRCAGLRSSSCRAPAAARPRSLRTCAAVTDPVSTSKTPVTLEFQREKAKELTKFFKQQSANALINDSTVFGWTKSNEINNGRWVMFGLLVGLMTELATGVDFPNQLKLTVSVLGIADVYD